ncbi:MAG: 1-phosphofructokinase family hexose kinase [Phycisphaerae bacterium]|nr:1-phosphofructokinase family hexose kinase [Phycisphaerae bacterium]
MRETVRGKTRIVTVTLNPAIDRVIIVEKLRVGEVQVGQTVLRVPGGKGVNVSHALVALNVPTIATGFLGADNRVDFLPLLSNPMIGDQFISMPGRTRENITLADPNGVDTHIRDRGLAVDAKALEQIRDLLGELATKQTTVVFSGSIPPGMTGRDFAALVDLCISAGSRVVVDTSDEALEAMRDKKLWILAPNERELARLSGRDLPSRQEQLAAAKQLLKRVEMVLFSCGKNGAYILGKGFASCARANLNPEWVRNTVGCGDVLLAAFLGGLWLNKSPREALVLAVAAAAASAAHPATATWDDSILEELLTKVDVQDV